MNESLPFFSIVVPTHGRPEALADCVRCVEELDYPKDRYELIVVDDGGGLPSGYLSEGLTSGVQAKVLSQVRSGPAVARNLGVEEAKGQLLAFTDDDCRPTPGWLKAMAAHLTDNDDCAVAGGTVNLSPNNLFAIASETLIEFLRNYYRVSASRTSFLTSNNFAISRDLYLKAGGFDASFERPGGEDRAFAVALAMDGVDIVHAPDALVYHANPPSFVSFCRKHFAYGRAARRFRKACRRGSAGRIGFEPLSFYLKLIFQPPLIACNWKTPFLFLLLLLSQCANTAGFAWEMVFGSDRNEEPGVDRRTLQ